VVRFFTGPNESLLEAIQAKAPKARVVKAFSCVGSALMVDPQLPGGKPTMFICGNDADAKRQARSILDQLGWEAEDCGGAEAARAIEPLCMLWCIPGFLRNDWVHAFKLLRK
jgi:predicted dinucleotide-binding enzyme